MKYLLIIGIMLTLGSCEKQEERCYTCHFTTWGGGMSLSETYNKCDTPDGIDRYEDEYTGSEAGASFTMNCNPD